MQYIAEHVIKGSSFINQFQAFLSYPNFLYWLLFYYTNADGFKFMYILL